MIPAAGPRDAHHALAGDPIAPGRSRLRAEWRRSRGFLSSIGVLSLGTVGAQALTAVAGVVLARRGGSVEFGIVTAGLGVVALTSDVTSLGTGTYLAREVAAKRWTPAQALAAALWRSGVCIAVVLVVDVALIAAQPANLALFLVLSLYCVSFNAGVTLAALARACGQFAGSALAGIVERVILVVTVAIVALGHLDIVLGFAGGLLVGSVVSASINGLNLWRTTAGERIRGESPISVWRLYRMSVQLGISGLASDLSVLESPLVSLGAGAAATGFYGAASKITAPLMIPAGAAGSVLFRTIAPVGENVVEVVRVLRRFSLILVPYAVVLTVVFLCSGPLVSAVLGRTYLPVTPEVLRILCVTALCAVLSQFIFIALICSGEERALARCLWVTVPLGLLLTLLGARVGGARDAAFGGLCAEVLALLWQGLVLRSHLRAYRLRVAQSAPRLDRRPPGAASAPPPDAHLAG